MTAPLSPALREVLEDALKQVETMNAALDEANASAWSLGALERFKERVRASDEEKKP
jgi:hypothetical protein